MASADLDQVMAIEQAVFPSPWQRSFFLCDANRPLSLALVAESAGRVAGYIVAWGGEELHVANVAVAPGSRRHGLGCALMRAAEQFGASTGATSVYLEVRRSNAGAQQFYRALGFVPTYVRQGYYENGEDAIVMEKDVTPRA